MESQDTWDIVSEEELNGAIQTQEEYERFTQEMDSVPESDLNTQVLSEMVLEEEETTAPNKVPLREEDYPATEERTPEQCKDRTAGYKGEEWRQHSDINKCLEMKANWKEHCRQFAQLREGGKTRNWMLTMNNPSKDFEDCLMKWVGNVATGSYLAVGHEYNSNDGPHIHVALHSKAPITMSALKKLFPFANIKVSGDGEKGFNRAILYALKDKDPRNWCTNIDWFKSSAKNKRKRDETCKLIASGELKLAKLKKDDPAFYAYNVDKLMRIMPRSSFREREVARKVYWWWGEAGTGKSHEARVMCDAYAFDWGLSDEEAVWKPMATGAGKWFDGLIGQPIAFLDELRGSSMSYATLLNLLGNQDHEVEIKGSITTWNPKVVCITSSIPPWELYKGMVAHGDGMDQLCRRIYRGFDLNNKKEFTMGEGNAQAGGFGPNGERPYLRFPDSVWWHYMEIIKAQYKCIICKDTGCINCTLRGGVM